MFIPTSKESSRLELLFVIVFFLLFRIRGFSFLYQRFAFSPIVVFFILNLMSKNKIERILSISSEHQSKRMRELCV